MRRREFIAGLGSMPAWPMVVQAQEPTVPVIGWLHVGTPATFEGQIPQFQRDLSALGFVVGRNVTIEYRWADGNFDRLPALAADLVNRQVAVILATGLPAANAARAATSRIPVVFIFGEDPVKEGLVATLSRPGSNVTGITTFGNVLYGKRLGLLREITPNAKAVAFLVNSSHPNAASDIADMQAAASAFPWRLVIATAAVESELDAAFGTMIQQQAGAMLVNVDPFLNAQRARIVELASRHAIPAIYDRRDFATAGGLMSYGGVLSEVRRQTAIYVSRILKGEKPADLPVHLPTKFEFVINLKTAKALGLDIPPGLLAIVDEVIE
jgi:putative tryptophan/tyrosine transport system substrate-binding protein